MEWRINDYSKYSSFIWNTEQRFNLPANMLAIVLWQASKYDPAHIAGTGRNPIGVIGIGNLTLADCRTLWNGADRRTDPLASIAGAGRLLRDRFREFNDWKLALAAYHSDSNSVRNHMRKHVPMPFRAVDYVQQVAAHCRI